VVAAFLVAVGVVSALPQGAAAADRQEVALTLSFIEFDGATTTHANDHVLQGVGDYFGVASGPSPFFGGEAGADIRWTINTAQKRGALTGAFSITGNPAGISWFGELHGHVTPDGGSGTLTADAVVSPGSPFPFTARRLVGTWTYEGVVDPASPHSLVLSVTAVVKI
jgi:hypothetical protein